MYILLLLFKLNMYVILLVSQQKVDSFLGFIKKMS